MTDSRKVLWANLSALMLKHWEGENLTKLAAVAHIGPGTASRLKAGGTSIGIDVIDRLAAAFKVHTWQLLVPDMDANDLPVINSGPSGWPFPRLDRTRFDRLDPDDKVELQGALRDRIKALEEEAVHRQIKTAAADKAKTRKSGT